MSLFVEAVEQLIRDAFAGVTLGDGVGLWQGEALDADEGEEGQAKARGQDETEDWTKLTPELLDRCHSAVGHLDAAGMRFHLPAILLADLGGRLQALTIEHRLLDLGSDRTRETFSLLDQRQRDAVREFLVVQAEAGRPSCLARSQAEAESLEVWGVPAHVVNTWKQRWAAERQRLNESGHAGEIDALLDQIDRLGADVSSASAATRLVSLAVGPVPATATAGGEDRPPPVFVDLQINGYAGVNFGDPFATAENLERCLAAITASGTSHFLPTLITDAPARLSTCLRNLAALAEDREQLAASLVEALRQASVDRPAGQDANVAGSVEQAVRAATCPILGFHLEGPYLSPVDGPRGAHPKEFVKGPDWDEFRRFQEAAGGRIVMITVAPEWTGMPGFIEKAVDAGVLVAIGHTAATREQIRDAVTAGASLSTHLGNGLADQLQRHHNPLWPQLAEPKLTASLILDGHHLPDEVARSFIAAKGADAIILVSDAVHLAGLPPGRYAFADKPVDLAADGAVRLVGEPRLAGSGACLADCVKHAVATGLMTTAGARRAAREAPLRLLRETGRFVGHPLFAS